MEPQATRHRDIGPARHEMTQTCLADVRIGSILLQKSAAVDWSLCRSVGSVGLAGTGFDAYSVINDLRQSIERQ